MKAEACLFRQLSNAGEALLNRILPSSDVGRLQEMTSAQLEQIISLQDQLILDGGSLFQRNEDNTRQPFDFHAFQNELFGVPAR